MAEHPEVGDLYEYGGRLVKVVSVKKRGRGWQVYFEADGEPAGRARMKDFLKSAQNATIKGVKGHTSLGNEHIVHTSRIERIGYGDDGEPVEIETRNTIYRVAR